MSCPLGNIQLLLRATENHKGQEASPGSEAKQTMKTARTIFQKFYITRETATAEMSC